MNIKGQFKQLVNEMEQKGFFHLLSANVLIQTVAFASQLFVAGILSPDDIGRIKIIQTFLSVFSVIAGMGFGASTLKLCSENRSKEDRQKLFSSSVYFTLISTTSLYIIVLIINSFGVFSSDALIVWLIPIGMFPVISNSLFMVFVSYFQAMRQIKTVSKITTINKIISIAAIVLMTYWLGIKGYYIAYNLSFIIMLLVSYSVLKKNMSLKFSSVKLKSHFPDIWKYARPSLFANLLSELAAYIDIFLISFLIKDMNEIGFYSFALTLVMILKIFPATVQQITAPYFSGLVNNKPELIKTFNKHNKQLFIVVLVSLIIAQLFIAPFTELVFNSKLNNSIPYFRVLAIGWSIRQLIQLQSAAIFGLGKIHYNAYISLISLIFNITVYSLSIYYFGLKGAAWASIPGGIVIFIASYIFLRKALKFE